MIAKLKSTAVMARRHDPSDSLDFFPTPPWATRALLTEVLSVDFVRKSVWEPAAGEGHMAEVLGERFGEVFASDVHDYGKGYAISSFVGQGPDVAADRVVDWIITNPPFNLASEFLHRGLRDAAEGVALLLRTSWLEGGKRYREIFKSNPPSVVAIFSERVPMVAKRWDPDASSATSYAWFVWQHPWATRPRLMWIPPGQRVLLERTTDRRRFTTPDAVPLFGAAS
jgi:hypothetical protein